MQDYETPVESINLYLPLPYRILLIIVLGVWLFGLNLHYFHAVRIDSGLMLRYTRSSTDPPLHRSVYRFANLLSVLFAGSIVAFWMFTKGDPGLVRDNQLFPISLSVIMLGIFLWPGSAMHGRGRLRFSRMMRRVLIGGLDIDLRFADILLADALTSYAKVLGDMLVVLCMFFSGYSATNVIPNRTYGGLLVPAIIALPSLCRFRQCLIEHSRATAKGLPRSERAPHLYNAAKYASAFPVIIFSALQRVYDPLDPYRFSQETLTKAWYFSVFVNSMYCFYWDVTRDWELSLLTPLRNSKEYPWGLRRDRHFVKNQFYYGAVIVDFLLRITWSLKLSSHLWWGDEGGIFLMEILEVLRRWIWVFFRVEKEFVCGARAHGLGILTDVEEGAIMMNEYQD